MTLNLLHASFTQQLRNKQSSQIRLSSMKLRDTREILHYQVSKQLKALLLPPPLLLSRSQSLFYCDFALLCFVLSFFPELRRLFCSFSLLNHFSLWWMQYSRVQCLAFILDAVCCYSDMFTSDSLVYAVCAIVHSNANRLATSVSALSHCEFDCVSVPVRAPMNSTIWNSVVEWMEKQLQKQQQQHQQLVGWPI